MRLGIDFGTTRTVVAAAHDGGTSVVTFDVDGAFREWLPGTVVERRGRLLFGWDAVAAGAEVDGAIRSLKRAASAGVPDDTLDALPSRPTALESVEGFGRHLADLLRGSSNLELAPDEPLEAMIAVPANASSRQRWLTLEAFRRAGFEVLGVLNEPTAAAIEYAHRHLEQGKRTPKRYVVVYDLGGGTFDTSALSLAGRRFDLLATEGVSRLGGDDFDASILALALERAGLSEASIPGPTTVALLDAARAAKEAMTATTRNVMVDLSGLPGAGPVVIDAASVLACCEPLVVRTLETVEALFSRLPAHGIDPESARELGGIYVVGGGAAFPGVARALRARFGRKILLAPVPHAATAIGLAVAASPEAEVFVREAVTRHFGVWREGDGGRDKIFDPIFGKDTMPENDAPIVVTRVYHPRHTVGHLRFLECSAVDDHGAPAGDLTPWRDVYFPYDPSLADRDDLSADVAKAEGVAGERIVETYVYEPNGLIRVTIANTTRGYVRAWDLGRLT